MINDQEIRNKEGKIEVFGLDRPDYFVCDRCGRQYTFSGSYFITPKGEEYRNRDTGKIEVAEGDLCRECSHISRALGATKEKTINAACKMEERGINSSILFREQD